MHRTASNQEQLSRPYFDCRTQALRSDYSLCLADPHRNRCPHALLFADEYLCLHPLHRKFVD